MHFIRRPTAFLQVPNFQTPAVYIAGQPDLPPPLDTYLFHGSDLADAAILWLTADPNVYQFAAQITDVFGDTHLYHGYVFGGAVIETSPGVPAGMRQSVDTTGVTNGRWYEGRVFLQGDTGCDLSAVTGNLELVTLAGVVRAGGNGGTNMMAVTPSNQATRGLSGAGTTTSATYVAMPGTPGIASMVKVYDTGDSELLCRCSYTLFTTVNGTDIRLGVRINGVDTEIIQYFPTNANERYQTSGEVKVTGLNAGTYSVALVWRRQAGAGTLTVSALDSFSLAVQEVAT